MGQRREGIIVYSCKTIKIVTFLPPLNILVLAKKFQCADKFLRKQGNGYLSLMKEALRVAR